MSLKQSQSLRSTFTLLKSSSVNGVPGVLKIEGKKSGITFGLTAFTHGNEPSGIAAMDYLLNILDLPRRLERGTIYLCINNLAAAESYFNDDEAGKHHKYRFIDLNMNRLPENMPELKADARYEVRRARELLPIWRTFDVGFDIHSTSQDSEPMLVGGRIPLNLVRDFPIETMLTNIDVVQIGLPAFGFYGDPDNPISAFEIEAGGHENPSSLKRAQECAVRLLRNLGMIAPGPLPGEEIFESPTGQLLEYRISGSVMFPDTTYQFARVFKDGEQVQRGTVFAIGAKDIVAESDCHTFFCPASGKMTSVAEEAMFLSDPAIVHSKA